MSNNCRILCILATHRSGSTYLAHLISSTNRFVNKAELFNPGQIGPISNDERMLLAGRIGEDAYDNQKFIDWRRSNPQCAVEDIIRCYPRNNILFKLFNSHLSVNKIQSDILGIEDILYIILKIRPIDMYISRTKAIKTNKYTNFKTNDIKIEINAEYFINWSKNIREWYDWIFSATSGKNRIELSYDRHINGKTTLSVMSHINSVLHSMDMAPLGLGLERIGHMKQDLEPDYRQRVSNWNQFESKLRGTAEGFELLDWAQTIP